MVSLPVPGKALMYMSGGREGDGGMGLGADMVRSFMRGGGLGNKLCV